MDKEGYDRAFTAALIAAAATIANLIPPSIMAVVYGATGNVSIGGLFLAGVVPGLMVGAGLMIYSYFFGPHGIRRPRATFGQFSEATKAAALPLVIPIIIMGGILTGWFTPTEAGLVAVTYIVFFLIPIMNRGHLKNLPRDFANVGLMYSIPLAAVAAASAFGWMLAFLKGPEVVSGWNQRNPYHAFVGRAVRDRWRLRRCRPGDHHLHADPQCVGGAGADPPRAHGGDHHHNAGIRINYAALWDHAADVVEVCRCQLHGGRKAIAAALHRIFYNDPVLRVLPTRRAVAAEDTAAGIGRVFQEPERPRPYLPAVLITMLGLRFDVARATGLS
jgi:hypothetical protein